MTQEGSSPSAPTAQLTEINSTTAPEGDRMDMIKTSLALMSMHHAGNPAGWLKDLRDAERYDPFLFSALQQDPAQQHFLLQVNGPEPRGKKEESPISDSETRSEGSSASTILLVENEHDINAQFEGDGGDEQNEDVDEEMTEYEAENLVADGDGNGTEGDKLSNSGQEDAMVDSEFRPSEAAPDDLEIVDSDSHSDSPAHPTKRPAGKSAWRARPRKGKAKVKGKRKRRAAKSTR